VRTAGIIIISFAFFLWRRGESKTGDDDLVLVEVGDDGGVAGGGGEGDLERLRDDIWN
jgi:hypothetical protein